jgi:enolase
METFQNLYESINEAKKVKIVASGKGEMKKWQLMAPDGSELVDMEFSSPAEAKKYAKKKGFQLTEADDKAEYTKAQKTAIKAIKTATKAIEKLKGSKNSNIGIAIDESLINLGFAEDAWGWS